MHINTEFRSAVRDPEGTITCEIRHPVLAWVPFTASPNDVEPHGRALFHHMDRLVPRQVEESPE